MNTQALQKLILVLALALSACGRAIPLASEGYLGEAITEGTGASRVDGVDLGIIYPVTTVISATSGNPYSVQADLPFTGAPVAIGQAVVDGQTPFAFNYSYPPNNYKLSKAHLVIDTSRDSSDTEGIFVDGILSGRPPTNMVNLASAFLDFPVYLGNVAGYVANTYYIDWSLSHYKRLTRNTFDLDVDELIKPTTVVTTDLVKDGFLPVVTGDDSPVYQGFLVLKGYTISKSALNCANSPSYSFQNVFLHNDGNSIGQSAFSGEVLNPYSSTTTAVTGFRSIEWFFDAQLPRVTTSNVSLSLGTITMAVRRRTTVSTYAAIVVNGIGVQQPGFDRNLATAAVESWYAAGETYFSNWITAIPADNVERTVTLDLAQLLGANQLRDLIAQGKLNIALAGSIELVRASAASATRGFGVVVSGPELNLQGTYYTQLCDIPNDPSSPLSDSAPIPSGAGDNSSPLISSKQASEVTSSSAAIQWLTNEGADSQVCYGIGNTNTCTGVDSTMTNFHRVVLTGLQPYKVYTYRVKSADGNGNLTVSGSAAFQTLR